MKLSGACSLPLYLALAVTVATGGCGDGGDDSGGAGSGGAGTGGRGGSGSGGSGSGGSGTGGSGTGGSGTGGASGGSGGGVGGSGGGGAGGGTGGSSNGGAGGRTGSGGSSGDARPGDASAEMGGAAPVGPVGKTVCINADGAEGMDTYPLLESVLGTNCVEQLDSAHSPPFKHVKEDTDAEVGPHFVFYSHPTIDGDFANHPDRMRIEIKVHNGAAEDLKGKPGKVMTYTWRFKMGEELKFSNRFSHLFQLKSYGGNEGSPLITITGRGGASEALQVIYVGDPDGGRTLTSVPMAGLKGIWLDVMVRAEIANSGTLFLQIKKPDGTTVLTVNTPGLDLWRQGDYIRGKWGIYRGKSPDLGSGEHTVRYANIAITPSATPSSTCR